MKSRRHVFLEIDEGLLILSLVTICGRKIQINACRSVELAELRPERITKALSSIVADLDVVGLPTHVAFGDRRFVHTRKVLPRMEPHELRTLVEREIRREGSLAGNKQVLSTVSLIKKVKGGRYGFALTGLPREVWEPFQQGIEGAGLNLVQMTSLEDASAAALPLGLRGAVSILDLGTSRIRFIHCEDRHVRQARRIFLPTTNLDDASDAALAASHLALEVPRTLEFLAGLGCKAPETLVLGQRLSLSDEDLLIIAGDIPNRLRLDSDFAREVGLEFQPSLATQGLINSVVQHKSRSVLAIKTLAVSRPIHLLVGWAAVCSLAVVATLAGVVVNRDLGRTREALERVERESRHVADRKTDWLAANSPDEPPADPRLSVVLGTRRPISHLVGEVCRTVPVGVHLTSLRLVDPDQIEITGNVSHESRFESLGIAAQFVEKIAAIDYVSKRSEEIKENPLRPGTLSFRVLLQWRKP